MRLPDLLVVGHEPPVNHALLERVDVLDVLRLGRASKTVGAMYAIGNFVSGRTEGRECKWSTVANISATSDGPPWVGLTGNEHEAVEGDTPPTHRVDRIDIGRGRDLEVFTGRVSLPANLEIVVERYALRDDTLLSWRWRDLHVSVLRASCLSANSGGGVLTLPRPDTPCLGYVVGRVHAVVVRAIALISVRFLMTSLQ